VAKVFDDGSIQLTDGMKVDLTTEFGLMVARKVLSAEELAKLQGAMKVYGYAPDKEQKTFVLAAVVDPVSLLLPAEAAPSLSRWIWIVATLQSIRACPECTAGPLLLWPAAAHHEGA